MVFGPDHAHEGVIAYNYSGVTHSRSLPIACSLGTPEVATWMGGFREYLTDTLTGHLVPPDAPESLAEVASEVLSNPAGVAKMADWARALMASTWSWADSARVILDVYRAFCCPMELTFSTQQEEFAGRGRW